MRSLFLMGRIPINYWIQFKIPMYYLNLCLVDPNIEYNNMATMLETDLKYLSPALEMLDERCLILNMLLMWLRS